MQAARCVANAWRATYDRIAMLVDAFIFAAGVLTWTLVEYVIHGVLGHAHRTFVTPMHDVHHRDPHAVFAIGAWIPTAVLLLGSALIFGAAAGVIFYAGLVAGFAVYEIAHWRIHFAKPCCEIEARMRARHLAHHLREPDAIFGVTTPLWDIVFGTQPSTDAMRELAAAGARVAPLDGASNLGRLLASLRSRIAAP
jgi:sterol desaturase/sphingolipid hydroxylase (fatty acid hydroxylase superfamily)